MQPVRPMKKLTTETIILDKYSPAEYAAFWGCDPCYDKAPRFRGDGYLFYNFGAEELTNKWLDSFIQAIDRSIESVKTRLITAPMGSSQEHLQKEEQKEDIQGLTELKAYVQSLKNRVHKTETRIKE